MRVFRPHSKQIPLKNALLVALGLLLLAACTGEPAAVPATESVMLPAATSTMPATTTPSATITAEATATPGVPAPLNPTAAPAATLVPTVVPCPMQVATIRPLDSPAFPLEIAFVSEGNAWLWSEAEAGAAPLAILDRVQNAAISGDGQYIAFTQQVGAGEELWVIGRDGYGEQLLMGPEAMLQLVNVPLADAVVTEQLDWVPGTHTLVFNSSTIITGVSQRLNNDLRLINVDNGQRPLWLPVGQGGAFSFSPDGQQVALWQPGQLSLASTDGDNAPAPVISYTATIESSGPLQPVWAADSRSFMAAVPGQMGVFSMWEAVVGEEPAPALDEKVGIPGSAAISPNLAVVAYLRPGPTEFEERELHLAAPDGSWDIVYDAGLSLEFKGWSPDGVTFAYQLLPAEGADATAFVGKLCAQRTRYAQAPTHGEAARVLVWADGERFVYVSGEPGAWELRLGSVAGESELLADMNQPEPIFDVVGDR